MEKTHLIKLSRNNKVDFKETLLDNSSKEVEIHLEEVVVDFNTHTIMDSFLIFFE